MVKLPRKNLSWTQFYLFWKTSTHREYIKKYLYEEPIFVTPEMAFGRRVSDNMEKNLFEMDEDLIEVLSRVPAYDRAEEALVYQFPGWHTISYLDSFNSENYNFLEYKTGKTVWDQQRVNEHEQLDFYAWAIWKNFGVIPDARLVWMETDKAGTEVFFTGNITTFDRRFDEADLQQMEDKLIVTAEKITKIYEMFLNGVDFTDAKESRELIKEL